MCNCIAAVDKLLAKENGRIAITMQLVDLKRTRNRISIVTQKLNPRKRGNLPPVLATFCPWCGKQFYEQVTSTTNEDTG